MILIYTDKITNRLTYTLNLIFNDIIGITFRTTTCIDEFEKSQAPKINYSKNRIKDELYIYSHNLLFETGIKLQDINVFNYYSTKGFFKSITEASMPFDMFAASFFLASRYEEHLPFIIDNHGRYSHLNSVAFQNNFLSKPIINIWTNYLVDIITKSYPSFVVPLKKFNFIPTIDIDCAYAYRAKGVIRIIAGMVKSISHFSEIINRIKVLTGFKNDPFNTYQLQYDIHKKYNVNPIYFILFAHFSKHDKGLDIHNKHFHSIIKYLADIAQVGIHPSYLSNTNFEILSNEISGLRSVVHREITKSRQHYVKLSFPITYRNLIDNDITEEFSMGYPEEIGFRASICSPYFYYDLDNERETNMKIFPFAIMDGTLKDYKNIKTPQEAIEYIKPIINEIKAVNGTLITIWHNETFSNEKRWTGWNIVYEEILSMVSPIHIQK